MSYIEMRVGFTRDLRWVERQKKESLIPMPPPLSTSPSHRPDCFSPGFPRRYVEDVQFQYSIPTYIFPLSTVFSGFLISLAINTEKETTRKKKEWIPVIPCETSIFLATDLLFRNFLFQYHHIPYCDLLSNPRRWFDEEFSRKNSHVYAF